jgi:hypothetical protein
MRVRVVVCLGAVMVCLVALTPVAHACSCFAGDPRDRLAAADGAFIGVVTERDGPPPGSSGFDGVTYTFRVEERFKGDIGETVEVNTAPNGAACGLESGRGDRLGLLLERGGGEWYGGLCGTIDPDELRKAAAPYPKANGSGPLTFLVSGNWGDMRTLGLDDEGRTLRYGPGVGNVSHVSVCPGSRAAAEVVVGDVEPYGPYVVVRDLETFKGVWKARIDGFGDPRTVSYPLLPSAVACRSPSGDDVLVFGANNESDLDDGNARIVRVGPEGQSLVWQGGKGGSAVLPSSGSKAYVASRTEKLVEVDTETGAVRDIGAIDRPLDAGLALSPDRRSLAALGLDGKLSVVDVRSGDVTSAKAEVGRQLVWASDDRLLVTETGELRDSVMVFDRTPRRVGTWSGWEDAQRTIVVDGTAYGTAYKKLVKADALQGGVKDVRMFDTPELTQLAYVPPRPVEPKPTASPTSTAGPEATAEPSAAPTPETVVQPNTFAAPTPGPAEPVSSSSVPAVATAVGALLLAAGAFAWRRRSA